jgi:hypothetical protein
VKLVIPGQNLRVDTPLGVDPVWYEKLSLLFKNAASLVEGNGVLPVANGGTGDTGSAWNSSFTPVITAGTGAFTSVSATFRYKLLGKTAFFSLNIFITTNGTAAANVQATTPFTFAAQQVFVGRANQSSGKMLQGSCSAGVAGLVIWNYDNTYPGASGERLLLNGVAEIQ